MSRILTFIWLVSLFLSAAFIATAEAANRFEIKQMVMREAANSNVPVSLALAVAKIESDFNARALSSAGARGVMQIMPATGKHEFGVSPNRLWDARLNISIGVQFLEQLHKQYNGRWDMALSHYNGGTIKGSSPHKRTQKYVRSVQKWQRVYQEQASLWVEGEDKQNIREEYELADLTDWEPRSISDHFQDDPDEGWLEDDYEDDARYGDTRIIIVDRRDDRGWRRPPPPPAGHFRRGPPPRRHFR